MSKRYKRKRKPLRDDEVSELPYKVFEEELKKAGITCVVRVNRKKNKNKWKGKNQI